MSAVDGVGLDREGLPQKVTTGYSPRQARALSLPGADRQPGAGGGGGGKVKESEGLQAWVSQGKEVRLYRECSSKPLRGFKQGGTRHGLIFVLRGHWLGLRARQWYWGGRGGGGGLRLRVWAAEARL